MAEEDQLLWIKGPNSMSANMGFRVTKEVAEYVSRHGLDYVYNRKGIQKQLDAIKALLGSQNI
jgi:hypothetical protein